MALPSNIIDREFKKFEEDNSGKERIKTKGKLEGGTESNDIHGAHNALATMDYMHDLVHEGKVFSVTKRWEDLPTASGAGFLIHVDADYDLGTLIKLNTEGEWHVRIYENPTVIDNGTQITAYNFFRGSTGTINSEFYHTPEIGWNGTSIWECEVGIKGAGQGEKDVPSWRLRGLEDYYISMVNHSTGTACASIEVIAHEDAASIVYTTSTSSSTTSSSTSTTSTSTTISTSTSTSISTSTSSTSTTTTS